MDDDAPEFRPDAATRTQIDAADPAGSVWLAANAGSGKTRVLTDRVAWLLLNGTAPERILCLTYTKAAAGEMQNRLFARLGRWTMLSDDALRVEITHLGAGRGTIPTDVLRRARTLFARAIETPGGLKIQTIHAFCASLLRRFPLEAGVSPAFSEMDETAAARLHAEVLDAMASDPETQPLVDAVAARLTDGEPSKFLAAVAKARDAYSSPTETELRAALGIGPETAEEIRQEAAGEAALDLLDTFIEGASGATGKTMLDLTERFRQARPVDPDTRYDLLVAACLTAKLERRKTGGWPKAVKDGDHGPLVETFDALVDRMLDAVTRVAALDALAQTRALHAFGPAFAARVETRKAARGWLDFDDQIARTRRLLSTSDMAQWVLFKLDGGIDHILVDEAQDTSPDQWQVITRLAAEFGAGQGARPDVARTIFVVGDRKQSIYGFQGADLTAYERMRDTFAAMLSPGGPKLRDHALRHSFRSSPVILDLVDATFADGGGVGAPPEHLAFFDDLPGRVDLWPVIEKETEDHSDRKWHDPVDRPARNDADVLLAERVADAVEAMLRDRVPVKRGADRRAIRPGDILILLQRRKALFHHIVRACKARGLDLAGADRLKLSDDMAVKDLVAALTWAATPDDDLSLAEVLRSPLCAVDEAGLFALAHGRRGRLWDVLRDRGGDPAGLAMLTDLLRVADILRPYEVLQRILIRHDGRRRLLGRLGPESAEAIDALLAQALAYEQLETPSLTGFLGWLASADVDVKRQAGSGSIRVMSVHGAKGLESPVVILPETMKRQEKVPSGIQRLPCGTPVWMPPVANRSPALHDLVEARAQAEAEERDRLLYVAMTRAESWLIVGAAGDTGKERTSSWHNMVAAGMEARGAEPHDYGFGEGLRLQSGDWAPVQDAVADVPDTADTSPDWLETPVPPPARPVLRIAPSALPGAKALPGEGEGDPAALRRGTAVHLLLEHLPRLPRADWTMRARAILSAAGLGDAGDPADLLSEARAVLEAPDLAHVFAPGTLAEVPFALPGTDTRPPVFGTMDRVIVTDAEIRIVDFKTNRIVPHTPADTPAGLLAQMAAYREAAMAIWPGRRVRVSILWTHAPSLMDLPDDVVTVARAAIDPERPPA
ncbi:double-strand break repair helicase AddA [Jannaschia rubra]|uniref:double-strand break repair helicase AddA n=1 Tax=Jannaschia rubra TaxID=282197 RepID=UPI0024927E11|nr:double-strand break repair helicase AddA [Jannaschia rubra]